jgi:hypothetical protein
MTLLIKIALSYVGVYAVLFVASVNIDSMGVGVTPEWRRRMLGYGLYLLPVAAITIILSAIWQLN